MMISLKDKKDSEQIFSEVTIQQLDLSENLFLYAVHHYDKVCTILQWIIFYISFTSMTYFV